MVLRKMKGKWTVNILDFRARAVPLGSSIFEGKLA
jgi:hypothetical protein